MTVRYCKRLEVFANENSGISTDVVEGDDVRAVHWRVGVVDGLGVVLVARRCDDGGSVPFVQCIGVGMRAGCSSIEYEKARIRRYYGEVSGS